MSTVITKRPNGSRRVQLKLDQKSQVEQAHAGSVNINAIMAKYTKTGVLPQGGNEGRYGDFSNGVDFQDAQQKLIDAKEDFAKLPAQLRRHFDNDPAMLLDFVDDPANLDQAREMGLLPPDPKTLPPEPLAVGSPLPAAPEAAQPPAASATPPPVAAE